MGSTSIDSISTSIDSISISISMGRVVLVWVVLV